MLLSISASAARNRVTPGWSSASFRRIASARRYDVIASAVLPVSTRRLPMRFWTCESANAK